MLLYQAPHTDSISRPRLALDTNQQAILDTYTDNNRLAKPASYGYEYTNLYNENIKGDYSPASSPNPTARPPMSFPQPLSAPHDHPNFSQMPYSSRYTADRASYTDSAPQLDRRMSEPALLSGNHPAAYRVAEQPNRYPTQYASNYSPTDLSYGSRYAGHSRNDSNGSSYGEYRPQWSTGVKQEEAYSEVNPLISANYSPRPSTASTGVGGASPHHAYSISAASPGSANSASPDMPTMSSHAEHQGHPSSPSQSSKTYAFVSLPGTTIRKRPRRRYDEIERLYHCSWPDCSKSYGTLNHLNAHVVMQKHGQRRLPVEFKELRKQWRKAKKEGTFTPPSTNLAEPGRSSTPASSHSPYASGSYYPGTAASERRRRMTDPNPPAVAPYRSPSVYHPSVSAGIGGSSWEDEPSSLPERRYGLSIPYPSSNNAVTEDDYGSFQENAQLPTQVDNTINGYRSSSSVLPGYSASTQSSHQDHYGSAYTYPLPSPSIGNPSSYGSESAIHASNLSPPSPTSQPRYSLSSSMSSNIPLNRLPSDSMLLTPLNDQRPTNAVASGGDSEESRDRATPGSRSAGSEYDEPRGSYDLHSQPQQHGYSYDDFDTHADTTAGPYSLGRNRLPRDSTLLTPLNMEHMRYGSGKGI